MKADAPSDDDDTGIVRYFTADFSADAGSGVPGGHVGISVFDHFAQEIVCVAEGVVDHRGPAPEGCPDCAWSFAANPVHSVEVEGACEDYYVTSGDVEGSWGYSWGFAAEYFYEYNGTVYCFENNLMLNIDAEYGSDVGWFLFESGGAGDEEYAAFSKELGGVYYYDQP